MKNYPHVGGNQASSVGATTTAAGDAATQGPQLPVASSDIELELELEEKEAPAEPSPKFTKTQRVFAKDSESGLLYEAVIRRSMFGMQLQRQLKISQVESERDVESFFQQQPEAGWHYFVHYTGWNVRWDRWVEERNLYQVTESTKRFAKRISEEIKAIKERVKGNNSVKMAVEFEKIMVVLERQQRMEERSEELAKQGIVINDEVEHDHSGTDNSGTDNGPSKPTRQTKWTKAHLNNELKLRERQLQGRRNQAHADLLILPLALKKVMVEEWEIITQCGMIPILPAKVTVSDALKQYLTSKLDVLKKKNETTKKEYESLEAKQEWRDMVYGILLFFDQGVPDRLLYLQELNQYEELDKDEKRHCELYGCEVLLRMFVRLPCLLMEVLSEAKSRTILSKINDLVRYLLKHQGALFGQSYQKRLEEEVPKKKRKVGEM
jgi:mortality factor 4-like protein 1